LKLIELFICMSYVQEKKVTGEMYVYTHEREREGISNRYQER
jgi:hypothetical protein